jgi:hypothetical protein
LEETPDVRREILREVISAKLAWPVVGTLFRGAVNSAASKRNVQFFPPEEGLRFIQLLEGYPDLLSILRRPGQDFLVAPAGRSDLLASKIHERLYGIRRDLFDAFTTVSNAQRLYDKTTDRVVWRKPGTDPPPPASSVPIVAPTLAAELQLRHNFIETLPEHSMSRSLLTNALTDGRPLQVFGMKVKEAELQRKWHSFRTERLLETIQHWARAEKIEWKSTWLTEGPTGYANKSEPAGSERPAPVQRNPLQLLFSALDATDIQRISIPLDLVLKAISLSHKP